MDSKIGRHVSNKHPGRCNDQKAISKIIGDAARKGTPLLPMTKIQSIVGPYWEDRPIRKIAYE